MKPTFTKPLKWPKSQPRKNPKSSRFDTQRDEALKALMRELRLLKAKYVVVTSNLELKSNGWPYSGQPEPRGDHGVAVYFRLNGEQRCMACDAFTTITDNIQAIQLTISSLRRIERYGVATTQQMFSEFKALPEDSTDWRSVFGIDNIPTANELKSLYKKLAMERHPDRGGSVNAMSQLNTAYEQAKQEMGL